MLPHLNSNVTMGFYFFPRGGSAQVARYLCRALVSPRWKPTLFAGSIGTFGDSSNARRFFGGVDCKVLDYSPALADSLAGRDAMAGDVPMHASYEDKPGVPDRIILDLDDAAFGRQVDSWTRFFADHTMGRPDVVHLHHLTPMHDAVRNVWPDVPVITHLHGTELKMMASVKDGGFAAAAGRYSDQWIDRMRRWAADSDRVVVVGGLDEKLAQELLPVDPIRIARIASGVDTDVFAPRAHTPTKRLALWKRWLVDEPRGWRPGEPEGSIRYELADLAAFTDTDGQPVPVVLFAGRFMRFKRLQLLIEAHHVMRSTTNCRSVLIVTGGFPCEWEGEHPYDTVQRLGAEGVFFVGWRDHDELSEILNCSDVFAAPSVDEPFGLVYLEAMATGIPPIATNTGGPLSFVNVDAAHPTGWLVPPDDVAATARALVEAVSDRATRLERGRRSAQFVREHYSWASSARSFARLYDEVIDAPTRSKRSNAERSTFGVASRIGVA
jgi:glycosyltransferase involved in cell wall biosynthesis